MVCLLFRVNIGIQFMEILRKKPIRMKRVKQTMRALARNMTFLMKSIALGKEAYGLPEKEIRKGTNFIR